MTSENLTPAQDPSVVTDAVEAQPEQKLVIERTVDTVYRAILKKDLIPSAFVVRCSNEHMRILVSNGMAAICATLLRQVPFQVSVPDDANSKLLGAQALLCKQIAANRLVSVVDGDFENEYQLREFVDLVGFRFNLIDLLYPKEEDSRAGIVKRYLTQGEDNPFPGLEIRFSEDEGENLIASAQGVIEHVYNYFAPMVDKYLAEMAAAQESEATNQAEASPAAEQPEAPTETPTEG